MDVASTRLLSRIASNAHSILGLPQGTPTSAIRLIRTYFGRPDAVQAASAARLDGQAASWRRRDHLDATFLVDRGASPIAMQRGLAEAFSEYLLMFPNLEVACSSAAIETLARHLTVTDRCVLEDYATAGNDIAALSAWWMLDEADTATRIFEVLRASMPAGVLRATGSWAGREMARSA